MATASSDLIIANRGGNSSTSARNSLNTVSGVLLNTTAPGCDYRELRQPEDLCRGQWAG